MICLSDEHEPPEETPEETMPRYQPLCTPHTPSLACLVGEMLLAHDKPADRWEKALMQHGHRSREAKKIAIAGVCEVLANAATPIGTALLAERFGVPYSRLSAYVCELVKAGRVVTVAHGTQTNYWLNAAAT